jgi:hypothetical protein
MVKSKTSTIIFLSLIVLCLSVASCKKIVEVEKPYGGYVLDSDTAQNSLRLECLNPSENRIFQAYEYTEKSAGFRDLYLAEYKLADSIGNKNYRFRIYTHVRALTDSSYQTTDNNYNPYDDKVYLEFYKENGTVKEEYYISELPQTENYFLYTQDTTESKKTIFRYLAKSSNPDRFAVIKGKFRLIY